MHSAHCTKKIQILLVNSIWSGLRNVLLLINPSVIPPILLNIHSAQNELNLNDIFFYVGTFTLNQKVQPLEITLSKSIHLTQNTFILLSIQKKIKQSDYLCFLEINWKQCVLCDEIYIAKLPSSTNVGAESNPPRLLAACARSKWIFSETNNNA